MDFWAFIEWGAVALGLLALTYAALVIREEKLAYQDTAEDKEFGPWRLYIPSWWAELQEEASKNKLTFQRCDTDYDWQAFFHHRAHQLSADAQALAEQYCLQEEIQFDEGFHEQKSGEQLFTNSKTLDRVHDVYRIEGMATEKQEYRTYYDILVAKDVLGHGHLLAVSRSSVLNGAVEGPYFEEVLKNLEIIE